MSNPSGQNTNHYNRSPFMLAVMGGNLAEVIRLYEAGGVNLNERDSNADREFTNTPLMWAIANSNVDVAMYLLECDGIDVNAYCEYGVLSNTPILLAITKGASHVDDYRPDGVAVDRHSFEDLIYKLIEKGADINAENQDGYTATDIAALHRDVNLVKYLFRQGGAVSKLSSENAAGDDVCYADIKNKLNSFASPMTMIDERAWNDRAKDIKAILPFKEVDDLSVISEGSDLFLW